MISSFESFLEENSTFSSNNLVKISLTKAESFEENKEIFNYSFSLTPSSIASSVFKNKKSSKLSFESKNCLITCKIFLL